MSVNYWGWGPSDDDTSSDEVEEGQSTDSADDVRDSTDDFFDSAEDTLADDSGSSEDDE